MIEPFYKDDLITLFCANTFDVLPQIMEEPVSFIFADPPYGIKIVDATQAVGFGSVPAEKRRAFGWKHGEGGNGRPFSKDKRGWVRPENGMEYPAGGILRDGKGSVGGDKPFGNSGNRVIEAGRYLPITGDDSPETAKKAFQLCYGYWPKAVHVWWGGNYYSDVLPPSSCWLVWDKDMTGTFADGELAWTNRKTAVRFFRHRWNGLLKGSEIGEKRIHPSQKPVMLAKAIYLKYGKPDDLILSPFSGSGSDLLAAKQLNRKAIGVECEEHYCKLIAERLTQNVMDMDIEGDGEFAPAEVEQEDDEPTIEQGELVFG